MKKLSVVTPIYNEEESIQELIKELAAVLRKTEKKFEIIAVDDGSTDNSFQKLKELGAALQELKIIQFRRNFGQAAALAAGIKAATGDRIVTIDADLENDPADIPRLLSRLDDGYDLVSGWRKDRWSNQLILRKLPSYLANKLISWIGGVPLHDYGCTLKAYRKEIIENVALYGEMHRFIPLYVSLNGGRIAELVVNHRTRRFGQSKYGISRTFRVLLDLLFLQFFMKYMNRPIHFFGSAGFISLFLGTIAGLAAVILKVSGLRSFVETPLPIASTLFIVVGIQFVIMGILAEIIMRTYYESRQKTPYEIKQTVNL